VLAAVNAKLAAKSANYGPETWRMVEKSILLQMLDQTWKEHLLHLDHLRQGINLRAYAQRDPLNEYKSEAFELFQAMLAHLRERVTQVLCLVELQTTPREEDLAPRAQEMHMEHQDPEPAIGGGPVPGVAVSATVQSRSVADADRDPRNPETWGRLSRNEPCPCGSGKKYKHCHGATA
jgi:preprotein translocase subunit SecA